MIVQKFQCCPRFIVPYICNINKNTFFKIKCKFSVADVKIPPCPVSQVKLCKVSSL